VVLANVMPVRNRFMSHTMGLAHHAGKIVLLAILKVAKHALGAM
jgi:hypothetical protein